MSVTYISVSSLPTLTHQNEMIFTPNWSNIVGTLHVLTPDMTLTKQQWCVGVTLFILLYLLI